VNLLDRLHERGVLRQRAQRLATLLARVVPPNSAVLDVGCGDGQIDTLLLEQRADLKIHGVEVLTRTPAKFPVTHFDGNTLPFGNASFDVVLFVDVLHHTSDPMVLLREAARVARKGIVIKDHLLQGILARTRLKFMDYVGNARHGVSLPFNYWSPQQWQSAEQQLGLRKGIELKKLGLYPLLADLVFGAGLHFVAYYDLQV
jgi:SAM-dependent methyltransferase